MCRNRGIKLERSMPYVPQQNGKAERLNRTILERARCVLNESGLGKEFWSNTVYYAVYVINRSPTVYEKIPAVM